MPPQQSDDPRSGPLGWLDRLRGSQPAGPSPRDGRYVARPVRSGPPARQASSQRRAGTYGRQARPQPNYAPYAIGFIFIIFALLAFLYVGLDWATGAGRLAGLGLGNRPTPSAS